MAREMRKGRWGADLFADMYLPERPYAVDKHWHENKPMSVTEALSKRNIQINPPGRTNLLTIDVDHDDGVMRALDGKSHYRPTWIAENPENGHVHVGFRIAAPVATAGRARQEPIDLAADLHEGLRRSMGGDIAYKGFMTKNPLHPDWEVYWGDDQAIHGYAMKELAAMLRSDGFMPPNGWKNERIRLRQQHVGLGRNSSLFENLREWAYPQINKYWGDFEGLHRAIENVALQINVDMNEGNLLPTAEVLSTARSVAAFIRKSNMWKAGKEASDRRFSERQSVRGKKGDSRHGGLKAGAIQKQRAEERDALVWKLIEEKGNGS